MSKSRPNTRLTNIALAASLAVASSTSMAMPMGFIDNISYTTDTVAKLDWLDVTSTLGLSYNQVGDRLGKSGDSLFGWRYATHDEFVAMIDRFFSGSNLRCGQNAEYDCGYLYYMVDGQLKPEKYSSLENAPGGNYSYMTQYCAELNEETGACTTKDITEQDTLLDDFILAFGDTLKASGVNVGSGYTSGMLNDFVEGSKVWVPQVLDRDTFADEISSRLKTMFIDEENPLYAVEETVGSWLVRKTKSEPSQVPEPGVLALLGIGVAGYFASRRGRDRG